jgi:DNA-binding NtrC family response regulator
MKFKLLIIDDERNIRDIFTLLLREKGYLTESAGSGAEGLEKAGFFEPDVVLLDMNLPDRPGLDVLSGIKRKCPKCQILIITAYGTIKSAVEATKLGAYAYLEKPVDNEELLLMIGRALEVRKLEAEVEVLKTELTSRFSFSNIVGAGARMNSVFQMMHRIARVDGTALITGESGTGKELVARAIHFAGPRKDGPFVVVNCGAIPRDLIESEFFGHCKGAFTDAKAETTGKFELAQHGTIFLDEVGELSQEAQVKLLRALGEREIVKVGGTKTIPVDVRVIAATNKTLDEEIRKGSFREDLYFRLAVLPLHLPPLRERKEDIPLLCEHFLKKYGGELEKEILGISGKALEHLRSYSWPGNVRELENVIYESMVLCDGTSLDETNLPPRIVSASAQGETDAHQDLGTGILDGAASLKRTAQQAAGIAEKTLIEKALRESEGNKTLAARSLGISRKTLFNKMKTLRIED